MTFHKTTRRPPIAKPGECSRCLEPLTIYEKDNGMCWECMADLACEAKVAATIINEQITPVCQPDDGPGDA